MRVIKSTQVFDAVKNDDGSYLVKNIGSKSQKFTEQDFNNNFRILDPVAPPAPETRAMSGHEMLMVEVIPQAKQRYPTVGDWQFNDQGALIMKISDMGNKDYEFMVAIHEAVEAWLCRKAGITQEMVDAWDMGEGKDLEDPGSDEKAPYHRQHMLALDIEKALCDEMGINWDEYEQKLAETCPTE